MLRTLTVILLILFNPLLAFAEPVREFGLEGETVDLELMKKKRLPASSGVLITQVSGGAPADVAGLRAGDVIVAIGRDPVSDIQTLRRAIARFQGESRIEATRVRAPDDELTVTVTLPRSIPLVDGEETDNRTGKKPYSVVRVIYGTDRGRDTTSDGSVSYGPERSKLVFGVCDVTVPKGHKFGQLERPSMTRLEFSEDPARHVVLARTTELSANELHKEIKQLPRKHSALVFVHGYNVTFADAARRTAQMAYDLDFFGFSAFFSWPSQGRYLGYVMDESNVEFGRTDLKKFLTELSSNSSIRNIHLIAHSIGNRALTGAISELYKEKPEVYAKIKQVILAAPDIDADIFKRDIAPAIVGPNKSVTMYSSSGDWALKASKGFHGYSRAGESGEKIVVVPDLVTVDSSNAETGFLGHSYFAESEVIVADIERVLRGAPPGARRKLKAKAIAAGQYWVIPTD